MTRMKAKKRTRSVRKFEVQPQPGVLILLAEPKPVRGVKLKHVSAFTMLLSVLCLCAFIIGRVDAVPAGNTQQEQKVRRRQPAESGIFQAQQYVAESSQLRTRLQISS
jgi:hypothetical protein